MRINLSYTIVFIHQVVRLRYLSLYLLKTKNMKIDIQQETERFQKFMLEEGNHNIIFSGKFGMGKSYFLNQFFNNKFRDKYVGLFITPVNYSVANNEDIFEYIKVDILMQLMEKVPCDFDKFDISSSVATYYYLQNNLFNFIGNILTVAEKVNFGTDIFQALIKFKNRIESFKKHNSVDDKTEVFDFLKEIEYKRGSIYESDIITQIIQYLIDEAKKSLGERKVVLIIDDMDRIDPEHIFRILNVLSAHDDFCMSGKHKFNIDQTILVCDIDNIRRIFHARYGADVDFSGYIDKFYSKEIFRFSNEKSIIQVVVEQLNKTKNENHDNIYSVKNPKVYESLIFILKNLIRVNAINIRTLEKLEFDYTLIYKYVYYNRKRFEITNMPAFMIFELIKRLFETTDDASKSLLRLAKVTTYPTNNIDLAFFISVFIPLADLPQNNYNACEETLEYNGLKYCISKPFTFGMANLAEEAIPTHYEHLFLMIYDAFTNYEKYFSFNLEYM